MKLHVHVREKVIVVECGDGSQRSAWLCTVGLARYDKDFGRSLGIPVGLQKEGGVMCDPQARLSELGDGQHVFVMLKGDLT